MSSLQGLSHDQLFAQLHNLIQRDHILEADLIAHLGEVDARRLFLEQACPSMFHYCVHMLHFAEGVAYKRIAVARAARKFPALRSALESGDLHLTAASLLAPHLERECGVKQSTASAADQATLSAAEWVAGARHKTAREIKEWIADRNPREPVISSVRRVPPRQWGEGSDRAKVAADTTAVGAAPEQRPGKATSPEVEASREFEQPASSLRPSKKGRCEPLGARRYCIRFEADAKFHEQLQELRALLRHQVPDGDVAKILAQATGVLLEKVRKQKTGACKSPRTSQERSPLRLTPPLGISPKKPSRKIPAAIRRAVWERDGGRCTYVSQDGRQCESREFIEFHHQVPWVRNQKHAVDNIHLRCRSHNQYAAELDFGGQHMALFRKSEEVRHAKQAKSKCQLDSNSS